ncbi:MAG: tRNA pseudouridine(38-40) synthase TruA [Acidobacteria bacterium]|nr:tRNA pseudouridine(38-40) synthase TruA [Acidobacteriota bacterium]
MSSSDHSDASAQRWRLDLAYDGNGLNGFAYQPEFTTVVGLLRSTLASTLHMDEEPQIVGAGRTDTGVHAFAQVVHVDLPTRLFARHRGSDPERLMRSLNKQLRGQVRIMRAQPVSDDFHARFSALWREYRYLVLESRPPALAFNDVWSWSVEGPLDVASMQRAADAVLGTHDFRAFCRRPTNAQPGEALLRNVMSARWERIEDQWGMSPDNAPAVRLTIRAQSFCHNMVRCLTSTMVAIGQGRLPENTVKLRLESTERQFLPPPAPARGLSLVGVGYDQFAGGPSGFVR